MFAAASPGASPSAPMTTARVMSAKLHPWQHRRARRHPDGAAKRLRERQSVLQPLGDDEAGDRRAELDRAARDAAERQLHLGHVGLAPILGQEGALDAGEVAIRRADRGDERGPPGLLLRVAKTGEPQACAAGPW